MTRRGLIALPGLLLPFGTAATAAVEAVPVTSSGDPIIVYGERDPNSPVTGIRADSQLDENGIAAYGADTVGDLLGALAADPDPTGEGPFILINGQPASGLDDITDLPTEAVSRIQLLSRNAASALGQRPTRRVINVVIKPDHRQITLNSKGRLATAGDGRQADGEINLLKLAGGNRRSLVLRATGQEQLLESDRGIVSAAGSAEFDPAGNILSFPFGGGEIDPLLSALAGQMVTIAGVPAGLANPDLLDFAGTANQANSSDLGRFRSLLPNSVGASANANFTQKFGRTLLSLTLRGEHQESSSRTGPATASLRVPASSPFSPFGQDVTLATIFGDPQKQRAHSDGLTGAAVLNGPWGPWRYSVNANLSHRTSETRSDRGFDLAPLQAAIDSGAANPFVAPDSTLLGPELVERARGRATNGGIQSTLNGPLFRLPAGMARASLRLEWRFNRAHSTSTGSFGELSRRLRRDEALGAVNLQLPLLSSKAIGDVGGELSGALHHVTASGWLLDHGYALNWQPNERLSIRGAVNIERIAPPPTALTDPIITLDNVRTFDFIRQETVFVRYITGGNPDLGVERRRTLSLGGSWRPFRKLDLDLTADLRSVRGRGAFAALPPVNADVQAAFPDRFQRDSEGRLIAVDARPVPFGLVRRDELRWGANLTHTFGRVAPRSGDSGPLSSEDSSVSVTGWRMSAFASHSWTLASRRQARAGLPVIDLLDGGAIGYGGGVPRHRFDFGGGVIHRGIGLQVDGTYVGPSSIATGTLAAPDRLKFSRRALLDARLFVNLGPQLPRQPWAKGMRVSLGVENMFDSKLRVRDGAGLTPLGYQPYLLDPLGRVVTIALRKVF